MQRLLYSLTQDRKTLCVCNINRFNVLLTVAIIERIPGRRLCVNNTSNAILARTHSDQSLLRPRDCSLSIPALLLKIRRRKHPGRPRKPRMPPS